MRLNRLRKYVPLGRTLSTYLGLIRMTSFHIFGNIVDALKREIFVGTLVVTDGRITEIMRHPDRISDRYILAGFIDAHIHIESSMLIPTEFARLATVHGTVATVSDPHEIANVLGLDGIRFMLANAKQTPMAIAFGAPACVPATTYETSGAILGDRELSQLFDRDGITYLSEVMNFPAVLSHEAEMMAKLQVAHDRNLPIDGHAPSLQGELAQRYAATGISTDHECSTLAEALDKIAAGMHILIREGSAAKNYDALHPLLKEYSHLCMFCSDDRHPDDLVKGHMNDLVKRSIALGYNVMDVLQSACINPVQHYHLNVGLLQVGDPADLIVVDNLQEFNVLQTYCKGILAAENGEALLPSVSVDPINRFAATTKHIEDFAISVHTPMVRVIEVCDRQLITQERHLPAKIVNGQVIADLENDILKLTVVNRYTDAPPAMGLVKNFGLKRGAIASSVAHDSHNVIAVGTNDADLCAAVNAVIQSQGGVVVVEGDRLQMLPLPVAGLMSNSDGYLIAEQYARLNARVMELGSTLTAPFMTLSFMALLVMPELKLSDRGLFSTSKFDFVAIEV
jgi:adenine deaminase